MIVATVDMGKDNTTSDSHQTQSESLNYSYISPALAQARASPSVCKFPPSREKRQTGDNKL